MSYMLIRFVIYILAFCGILAKNKIGKGKNYILFCASILLISIVISLFPVENAFLSFETVEDAFDYRESGEIVKVVENENSGAVVFKKNRTTYSTFFVLKNDSGYKLCSLFDSKTVHHGEKDDISVEIHKVGYSDFYISVFGIASNEITVIDNLGNEFEFHKFEESDYIWICDLQKINYTSDYCLYINGSHVEFAS